MTSRPKLSTNVNVVPGLAAIALFAAMAATALAASFDPAAGFESGAAITRSIGYALFNLDRTFPVLDAGDFLLVFLVVAFVLDAALGAAVMLARRDGGES